MRPTSGQVDKQNRQNKYRITDKGLSQDLENWVAIIVKIMGIQFLQGKSIIYSEYNHKHY